METVRVWQKVIYLSGTNSFLMAGDPDFTRLKEHQDHVLHPLLGDGWLIRSLTPVMGGTAFVLLEKPATEANKPGSGPAPAAAPAPAKK